MVKVNGLLAKLEHYSLYTPHQGLWNWSLVDRVMKLPFGRLFETTIIWLDTLLLSLRTLPKGLPRLTGTERVLYIDCGVHEQGNQIIAVDSWFRGRVASLDLFGFEANPYTFRLASTNLRGIENLHLFNIALVGPAHDSPYAVLHLTEGGKGDSVRPERRSEKVIRVPAKRLSSLLPDLDEYDAVILRMNIEGSEPEVISDLIEKHLSDRVTGYFGMWDDLWKIDPALDRSFRELLRKHHIKTFTFNDRDFKNPLRSGSSEGEVVFRFRLFVIRMRMRSAIAESIIGRTSSKRPPMSN